LRGQAGDILVADTGAFAGFQGGVIRVDPASGAQTTVSSGGSFFDPSGVALEADGDILVADQNAFAGPGGVIRVDPASGAQTTVSSGGSFLHPTGVAVVAFDFTGFAAPIDNAAVNDAKAGRRSRSSGTWSWTARRCPTRRASRASARGPKAAPARGCRATRSRPTPAAPACSTWARATGS
jgi:hypothetical protein